MKLRMLGQYLIGYRAAIVTFAASRWTLAIGAVLVLSASLARNYDGKYLPTEGESLLHGLVVSVGNSFILFSIFYVLALARLGTRQRPPFARGYLAFLGLFWLTSPLAWLYAIPYERFLDSLSAIDANMWTLALVSVWRVALMTRVLCVLWGTKAVPTFLVVAFYSDALIWIAANVMEAPVVDFMGGLQHSPEEEHLAGLRFSTVILATLAAPVLLLASLIGLKWLWPLWTLVTPAPDDRPSRSLAGLAGLALAVWVPVLAITQPEQGNRVLAERMLRAGRIGEALNFMATRRREAFPPVWDPPPRVGYMEDRPSAAEIRAGLAGYNAQDWASELYFRKHWRLAFRDRAGGPAPAPDEVIVWFNRGAWRDGLDETERSCFWFHVNHDPRLRPEVRDAIRAVLEKHKAQDESAFFESP